MSWLLGATLKAQRSYFNPIGGRVVQCSSGHPWRFLAKYLRNTGKFKMSFDKVPHPYGLCLRAMCCCGALM